MRAKDWVHREPTIALVKAIVHPRITRVIRSTTVKVKAVAGCLEPPKNFVTRVKMIANFKEVVERRYFLLASFRKVRTKDKAYGFSLESYLKIE